MAKPDLLASGPSLAAIGDCIARFYGGERKALVAQPDGSWIVASPTTGKPLAGVRVVQLRGRYRFEAVPAAA